MRSYIQGGAPASCKSTNRIRPYSTTSTQSTTVWARLPVQTSLGSQSDRCISTSALLPSRHSSNESSDSSSQLRPQHHSHQQQGHPVFSTSPSSGRGTSGSGLPLSFRSSRKGMSRLEVAAAIAHESLAAGPEGLPGPEGQQPKRKRMGE